MHEKSSISDLLNIMARLRDRDNGCPWDTKQTFETISAYTVEEAYEVADAIDRRDYPALCDELGDLLLQVVFHARIAEEAGHFDFSDVVQAICQKMITRHPHVFGDEKIESAEAQSLAWEAIKRQERANHTSRNNSGNDSNIDSSALAGISRGIPEWQRALKLQRRAAGSGYDWLDVGPVIDKLHEELEEVRAEFTNGSDPERLIDEVGDVLFVCVNLARHAKTDVSQALRQANAKFERRFRRMETLAIERGEQLADKSLSEQEMLWQEAKKEERKA